MISSDHVDPQCRKMINQVLLGANRIKYNMETAVIEALTKMLSLQVDTKWKGAMASAEYLLNYHTNVDITKRLRERIQRGVSIKSIHDEWCFFAPISTNELPLKKHIELLGLPPSVMVDLVPLIVEHGRIETDKGNVCHENCMVGWVYDPKGYFWPKEV